MKSLISLTILFFVSASPGNAATHLSTVSGADLLSTKEISISAGTHKALVVVFLSAVCPCSNSHIQELKALAKDFPDFVFVGVHSNTDEKKAPTVEYFEKAKLPFPIIQDAQAKLADDFKALKTPHAFVIKQSGEVVYTGGVSSSHDFGSSDRKYLREALTDLHNDLPVRTPNARTLGCAIARGDKNVW